jgi:GntR family transcriptional regulator, carbon starvation induced regulator
MSGHVPSAGDSDHSNTLIGKAFESIRRDIITSKLKPGDKLRIAHLKKEYGVGTSPLREALSRLVSEGLVTAQGQRGFWVPPVSAEEHEDIIQTRTVLECFALRASIESGDDEWEGQIVGAYHNLHRIEQRFEEEPESSFSDWWDRNRLFHDALIAACPLKWLLRFHGVVFDLHNRYQRVSMQTPVLSPDLFEDHRLIMEAALDRDADRAVAALEEHIRRAPEEANESPSKSGKSTRQGDMES